MTQGSATPETAQAPAVVMQLSLTADGVRYLVQLIEMTASRDKRALMIKAPLLAQLAPFYEDPKPPQPPQRADRVALAAAQAAELRKETP